MPLYLTNSYVYDFYKDRGKLSKYAVVEALLSRPHLDIKSGFNTESEKDQYSQAKLICYKRLNFLIGKVQNKWFTRDASAKDQTFFNLEKYPDLIHENDSQPSNPSLDLLPSSQTSTISEIEETIPDRPIKRKAFDEYKDQWKRHCTNPIYNQLLEAAKEQGFEKEPWKFVAYLGKRMCHKKNEAAKQQFKNIYEGNNEEHEKFEPAKALHLKEHLQIGQTGYMYLRHSLPTIFPTWDELNTEIEKIMPDFNYKDHGVYFNFEESLNITVKRILNKFKMDKDEDIDDNDKKIFDDIKEFGVIVTANSGIDGSGGHAVYNSESSLADGVDTTHINVSGFCLLSIKINNEEQTEIFHELTPQSSEAERVLQLMPGTESRENFEKIYGDLNNETKKLNDNGFDCYCDLGEIKVKADIHIKQLDGKAQSVASGLGGGYCKCCKVTKNDAKKIERVKEGFTMDRDILSTWQLFDDLADEDGNVDRTRLDREGLTQRVLADTEILKQFPITHAYINILRHFLNVIYRINANVRKMDKRYTEDEKLNIANAKNEFRINAKKSLHMKLDQPDAYGRGGSTNTAGMARRFFRPNNRQKLLDLIYGTREEKKAFAILHKKFSVILRLISSKKKQIDFMSLEKYNLDTYQFLLESFGWATVPGVVHHVLAHSAERIKLNGGLGLGEWSEEGLETIHKLVRRFREMLARKTSLKDNLTDVAKHLLIRSDPIVRSYKRILYCSVCKGKGHTKRSCPLKKQKNKTSYDELVGEFFLN